MVDRDGFRPNVGIIIADGRGHILWAKRIGQDAWQFPQGGIQAGESPESALYRELYEEVGLRREDVKILGCTRGWLRYRLPRHMQGRRKSQPQCVGQKQKWFLLSLVSNESLIRFDCGDTPEFDGWQWVNYWYPVTKVVDFKRNVYRRALKELSPLHCDIERAMAQRRSAADA